MTNRLLRNGRFLLFASVSLLLAGCVSPPGGDPDLPVPTLPTAFGASGDPEAADAVASSAAKDWHAFFEDPQLVELIETALDQNQELRILLQEIEISKNEARARSGEYLPFVGLRAGAGAEKVGEYTRSGAVEESLELKEGRDFPTVLPDYAIGVDLSWEIDIWKKLRNAKKAAVLRYLATEEGRRFMVTHLVSEIARSYYELMALDNRKLILERMIGVQEDALAAVRLQKEAGETTELAVRRFEAEVMKNRSRVFLVDQRILETENRIHFLAGRYPQPIPRSAGLFDEALEHELVAGTPSEMLANRPDIRRAELELAAARLDVKVARARFYPRLDLAAAVGFRSSIASLVFATPESLAFGVAGDLMMPLLNRRAIQAAFDNATAAQQQAIERYARTVLNAYLEVSNQLSRVHNLTESLEAKRRQVDALSESVSAASQLFASARADYTEVLLTQRDALESRMELVELRQQQLSALVRAYRALGGGGGRPSPMPEGEAGDRTGES